MIAIRPAQQRGRTQLGWLDSRHTFSFGDYYDAEQMGFGALRVMNDDRVAPGQGFGTHSHRDMEILSYVLAGALEHKDSLGNGEVLRPGEFQRMTAGTGIRHSEFNPSADEPVHFYQIWIMPERAGLPPSYEQRAFPEEGRRGRWQRVASYAGRDGALRIHQDVEVFLALIAAGTALNFTAATGRRLWLQTLRGRIELGPHTLTAGDGAALTDEAAPTIRAVEAAEVLLFDLK